MNTDTLIYIVDDDAGLRRSLAYLLDSVGWKREAFDSSEAFLAGWQPQRPACLLLDVRMPGTSGLELQRRLRRDGHQLPIVFMTGHGDIPMAVEAMRAGAVDFIEKPFRDQALLDALERALHKVPAAMRMLSLRDKYATLTTRERMVAEQVAAGMPNKRIAQRLDISERTVQVHRQNALDKMGAASAAELAAALLRLEDGSAP